MNKRDLEQGQASLFKSLFLFFGGINEKRMYFKCFKKAMKNNDYSYDIYFRMAIIDEYLNGNLDVWKLYDKLQITRCKQISIIPREMMNHKMSL